MGDPTIGELSISSEGARLLADAFDNDTDEMSDVVLAERSAGERREHGLAIDAEQDERHEIGVIILANDALLLAKDENVSNKPLKRSTVGRWFERRPLGRGKGEPRKRGIG
jgi:hypothetical protein